MKKTTLFLLVFLPLASPAFSKQIVLTIPDKDIAIVENDVVDAEQWIKDAWAGKLNKCRERMIRNEVETSLSAGETIPASKDAILNKAMNRPGFKNRKQRDAEDAARER